MDFHSAKCASAARVGPWTRVACCSPSNGERLVSPADTSSQCCCDPAPMANSTSDGAAPRLPYPPQVAVARRVACAPFRPRPVSGRPKRTAPRPAPRSWWPCPVFPEHAAARGPRGPVGAANRWTYDLARRSTPACPGALMHSKALGREGLSRRAAHRLRRRPEPRPVPQPLSAIGVLERVDAPRWWSDPAYPPRPAPKAAHLRASVRGGIHRRYGVERGGGRPRPGVPSFFSRSAKRPAVDRLAWPRVAIGPSPPGSAGGRGSCLVPPIRPRSATT